MTSSDSALQTLADRMGRAGAPDHGDRETLEACLLPLVRRRSAPAPAGRSWCSGSGRPCRR